MRALPLAALLAAGLVAGRASAHAMPNSTVVLAPTRGGLEARVAIPLTELNAALGHAANAASGQAELKAYVRAHVSVTTPDGTSWPLSIRRMAAEGGEHPALVLRLAFRRPAAWAGPARLRYDAVNHRIVSHYVLVYLREPGPFGATRPLARLQYPETVLTIGPRR